MRCWGHFIMFARYQNIYSTDIYSPNVGSIYPIQMYIPQPCARRAHSNPPTYIHPPSVGMIYPTPNVCPQRRMSSMSHVLNVACPQCPIVYYWSWISVPSFQSHWFILNWRSVRLSLVSTIIVGRGRQILNQCTKHSITLIKSRPKDEFLFHE